MNTSLEAQILHAVIEGDKDHAEKLIRHYLSSTERSQLGDAFTDSANLIYVIQRELREL